MTAFTDNFREYIFETQGASSSATNTGHFEFARDIGFKRSQEDAAYAAMLGDALNSLSSEEIAASLRDAFLALDAEILQLTQINSGSTACNVIFDGQKIYTGYAGDSMAFLVVNDIYNNPLKVIRLNSSLHSPDDPLEKQRIQASECALLRPGETYKRITDAKMTGIKSTAEKDRVFKVYWEHFISWTSSRVAPNTYSFKALNMSRSIGDRLYKIPVDPSLILGVTPEPTIDIYSIDTLLSEHHIDRDQVDSLQVISVSDGYTESITAKVLEEAHKGLDLTKIDTGTLDKILERSMSIDEKPLQEGKLMQDLKFARGDKKLAPSNNLQGTAKHLIRLTPAKMNMGYTATHDNTTLIMRKFASDEPFMLGVYDGHSGNAAADYAVNNFMRILKSEFDLRRVLKDDTASEDNKSIRVRLLSVIKGYADSFSYKSPLLKKVLKLKYRLSQAENDLEDIKTFCKLLCIKSTGEELSLLQKIQRENTKESQHFIIWVAMHLSCIHGYAESSLTEAYLPTPGNRNILFAQNTGNEVYRCALEYLHALPMLEETSQNTPVYA